MLCGEPVCLEVLIPFRESYPTIASQRALMHFKKGDSAHVPAELDEQICSKKQHVDK